jgi:competence protein ComEC
MLLIGISCAWILGIWLGSLFDITAVLILTAILPVPFIFTFKTQRKRLMLSALILFFFFSGAWLSPTLSHQHNSIQYYNNSGKIEFIGIVSEPPEKQDNKSRIIVSVHNVNGQAAYGKFLYNNYFSSDLKYGDVISGQIAFEEPPNFENFNYRTYLKGEGIISIVQEMDYQVVERNAGSKLMAWIFELRDRLAASLASALPEPQASLCQGIVLGIRNHIPPDLKSDLSASGTTHLLAISGLNLTIIAGLFLSVGLLLFGRRYYIYVWLTLVIIWFYSMLTGLQAPVIRSAIMASIFLLAEILGRQKNAFPALTLSAAIMVFLSPQVLFNLSFQLSFLAMIGLIYITPFFRDIGRKSINASLGEDGFWTKPLIAITDSFSVSLGAVIAVWPIGAYTFGIISFIGPLTTFLISPALIPIIIFGSLTAFVGLFNPVIAQIIAWIAWLFLSYMIVIAGAFATLPAAYLNNKPFNSIFLWFYYVVLLLVMNINNNGTKIKTWFKLIRFNLSHWSNSAGEMISNKAKYIMPPLFVIAILASLASTTLPDRNLKVSFLNVGEGEAILVQSSGQNILIDGGPGGQMVCQELGKLLPFYERKIDLLILSHPHLDHLNGLIEVMKRYQVGKILASPSSSDLPAYHEFLQLVKEKKIDYFTAISGQSLILSNGAVLDILNPPDTTDINSVSDLDQNSIVIFLTYGQHSFLLTSDIGSQTESLLIHDRLIKNADILKIPHHGSGTSSSNLFLKAVDSSVAVISVGANNQFGHPDKDVLARIAESGTKIIYRTDLNGTITFVMDINSPTIWVKSER